MLSGFDVNLRQSLLASLGFSCGFAASFNAPLAGQGCPSGSDRSDHSRAGITFAMEAFGHRLRDLRDVLIHRRRGSKGGQRRAFALHMAEARYRSSPSDSRLVLGLDAFSESLELRAK